MQHEYLSASNLAEALLWAAQKPASMFVAGGTDVMVNRQQGNVEAATLIDISALEELKTAEIQQDNMVVGALCTLAELERNTFIVSHFPALAEALRSVATPVLRQTATIGGNLLCDNRCSFYNQSEWWRKAVGYCLKCNGDICIATGGKKNCFSKFVSDTAPVLIALRASVELIQGNEARIIPLSDMYSGDGVNPHAKPSDTLLSRIHIPTTTGARVTFRKLRPRKTLDFTSLTTALALFPDGSLRAVIGGVDPRPVVVEGRADAPQEDFIALCAKKPRVVDNDFYSRAYRKDMISHFIKDSLQEILKP
jgi:4-hydroxybenzoyl-CoA reductase subunit beta